MTRLWFGSNFLKEGNYPTIELKKSISKIPSSNWAGSLWQLQMIDMNNYINLNDKVERNVWDANPFKDTHKVDFPKAQKLQEEVLPNGYRASFEVKEKCEACIFILKQSFHPNWRVKVNGEEVKTFPVFPFYL